MPEKTSRRKFYGKEMEKKTSKETLSKYSNASDFKIHD